MNFFNNPSVSFIFSLLLSFYLWNKNEKSDKWIAIFLSVVVANQLLKILLKNNIKNLQMNRYLSMIMYGIFLIHPLINILGSYTQINNGLSYEPLVLVSVFILYKLFYSPIPLDKINTSYEKGFRFNWANHFTFAEVAIYFILLFLPMYFYNPPKNVIMIVSSILFFVFTFINHGTLASVLPKYYDNLIGIVGLQSLYF